MKEFLMPHNRELRKKGQLLELGGTCYRIEGTEGMGGSSVVYLASYEDKLNRGERHEVLLKELFPCHPNGDIYRALDGTVCVREAAKEFMEYHCQRFRQGNQVNLSLVRKTPSYVSGNINSYEAYGTYYSVLFVHGGKTLQSMLEEREEPWKLKEIAEILRKAAGALECFHENGVLHLDISPDNLLFLPTYALLIDYNSVWDRKEEDGEFVFSEKPGYSAPEIRMRNAKKVGIPSDLYSMCAVFFRMLAGRPLSEAELNGNGLKQCLQRGFPILKTESPTVVHKVLQILSKGLHLLPAKRYQSITEFEANLEELFERIDKKGISHAVFWENSRYAFKRQYIPEERVLPQRVWLDGTEVLNLSERLKEKSLILLQGVGGMGKTTLLQKLWKEHLEKYHPGLPVAYYISLKEYQTLTRQEDYVHQELLKYLIHRESGDTCRDACHELEKYLGTSEKVQLILLLDGLNEAGEKRERLLREIEQLGKYPGVSILITDRTDEVKKYALKAFSSAELLPLEEAAVHEVLMETTGEIPENPELLQLLRNPMLLKLYSSIRVLQKENNDCTEKESDIQSVDVLVREYLSQLLQKQLRVNDGNEAMQLCCSYIFKHLLPAVAGRMAKRRTSVLSLEEMSETAETAYENLYHKQFGKCFPEYLGKSRLMMTSIQDTSEWFDFAVSEQLVRNLGLLVKSDNNYYRFMHDHLISALAQMDEENRKSFRNPKLLTFRILAAAGILGTAAVICVMQQQGKKLQAYQQEYGMVEYTEEEQEIIERIIACVQWNAGVLSQQITAQRDILEMAQTEEVLQGDPQAILELQEWIEQKKKSVDNPNTSELKEELVEKLLLINEEFPIQHLQSLSMRPMEMAVQLDEMLTELENILCFSGVEGSGYFYTKEEDRKEVVEAYQKYLDAYVRVIFYEFGSLMCHLNPEKASEVLADTRYSKIFRDYVTEIDWENMNPRMIDAAVEQATELLKETRSELKSTGFQWEKTK